MDEQQYEMAERLALAEAQAGIHKARLRLQRKPKGFDGYCECGEEIPSKRIKSGYYNCVVCQASIERKEKLFNK